MATARECAHTIHFLGLFASWWVNACVISPSRIFQERNAAWREYVGSPFPLLHWRQRLLCSTKAEVDKETYEFSSPGAAGNKNERVHIKTAPNPFTYLWIIPARNESARVHAWMRLHKEKDWSSVNHPSERIVWARSHTHTMAWPKSKCGGGGGMREFYITLHYYWFRAHTIIAVVKDQTCPNSPTCSNVNGGCS